MERISIIVPVYNVEEYLGECIDSLIEQTYENVEILLVDDGSTDSSLEICKKYAEINKKIKVTHKENGGLSDARNFGISIAKGEYLMFIDSDDTLEQSACEVLYHALKDNNADVAIGDLFKENEKHNENETSPIIYSAEEAICEMLRETSFNTSACGKLYKRELFRDIFFPKGKLYEDLGTIYKVLDRATRVVYVPYDLYYYRTRENSITTRSFNPRKMDLFLLTDEMISFLKEEYPQAVQIAVNRRTRYAISFLKEIAICRTEEKVCVDKLRRYVKENIREYLKSSYKITSKLFGIGIVINYSAVSIAMRGINKCRS
jgi:glycosyltransferase involved in cell wall biosynthesis